MFWVFLIIVAALIIYYHFFHTKSEKIDLSVLPEQFVVVDIETTGLDSEKHEIIEIGAIRVNRNSNMHTTFTALVKPKKIIIPEYISELTGITSAMLEREGEKLDNVIAEFLEFAGGARLVFFNAPFDYAFLSRAANQIGAKINNPISCALDMARRAWPELKSYRLTDLVKLGGFNTEGNHRALKDCELTIFVYGAAAHELKRLE